MDGGGLVDDLSDMPMDFDTIAAMLLPLIGRLAVWLLLFAGAVYVGFGAVFTVLSILFAIFRNLNSSTPPPTATDAAGRRRPLSAYSVFNPNQERIRGSIDPSQLQRQILTGR